MPRGVYQRQPKDEKPAAAPAKKVPAVTKAKPGPKPKKLAASKDFVQKSATVKEAVKPSSSHNPIAIDYQSAFAGFNILGANLSTLSEALLRLAGDPDLVHKVSDELRSTLDTLKHFRERVFGIPPEATEEPKAVPSEEAVEEEEEEEGDTVVASVHAAGSLPTIPQAPPLPPGNAAFVPPAPPIIPQH